MTPFPVLATHLPFPAQRNILEDPARGFLMNDTIIIKYTIELVVTSGGALSRSSQGPSKAELIKVPPPSIGKDMAELFTSGGQQCRALQQESSAWQQGCQLAGHVCSR